MDEQLPAPQVRRTECTAADGSVYRRHGKVWVRGSRPSSPPPAQAGAAVTVAPAAASKPTFGTSGRGRNA